MMKYKKAVIQQGPTWSANTSCTLMQYLEE